MGKSRTRHSEPDRLYSDRVELSSNGVQWFNGSISTVDACSKGTLKFTGMKIGK